MTHLKHFCAATKPTLLLNLCHAQSIQFISPLTRHNSNARPQSAADEQRARPLNKCPKITGWEMVTGFLPGGRYYNKDPAEFLRGQFAEKGDIILMESFMGSAVKVLTQNPDDFEAVFRNEGPWPKREGMELLTYHRKKHRNEFFGDKSGLLTTQGQEWSDFRTAVNPIIMQPKNVKVYVPKMSQVADAFLKRIKAIRDPQTLEVPDNFINEINRWTLSSVCLIALDKDLNLFEGNNPIAERFVRNIHRYFELSTELEIKPSAWRIWPTRNFKEAMRILDEMLSTTQGYIDEGIARTGTAKNAEDESVLEKLLKINKHMAVVMAMDMLFAGVDTTTSGLTSLLLCLAKNPDKQQKLRKELLRILPHKDSPLSIEQWQQLRYLRACIKESQRIYPLAIGNLRNTQRELILSGYRVPADSVVVLIHMNLLLDERHFSKPNEFIPERWMRDADAGASKSSHPFVYLPFGFGPRSCIGRRLAEMELEIGAARIFRNFHLEYNYPCERAFKALQINVPAIPLKFKFTDLSQ